MALVQSFVPSFEVPSQTRRFATASLKRSFDSGARRPEWIWAARGEDGHLLGMLGARMYGVDFGLVDLLSLPILGETEIGDASDAAEKLIRAVTGWAGELPHAETSFGAPPSSYPLNRPHIRSVVSQFAAQGWRLRVTRRHYEFATGPDFCRDVPLTCQIDVAGGGDRGRLEALVREVLPGSFDERDQVGAATYGLNAAATRATDELLDEDPIESVRFAVVEGHDVGFVIVRMSGTSGVVAHVGIARPFRGRGLAYELLGYATRELLARGGRVLIADTDDSNWPMAHVFEKAGWEQAESRIDLVLT